MRAAGLAHDEVWWKHNDSSTFADSSTEPIEQQLGRDCAVHLRGLSHDREKGIAPKSVARCGDFCALRDHPDPPVTELSLITRETLMTDTPESDATSRSVT